ncbi:MAG: glycogen/starch/alpha-glucan phosphorylase [Cyanobacteria bacterium J06638_7]
MTQAKPLTTIPPERLATGRPANLRLPTPGCYADPHRSGLSASDVFDGMTEHLFYTLGKLAPTASRHDLYMALSYAVRDRLMTRYLAGVEALRAAPTRVVAYLSAEFLIGPQLGNNLLMLGIQEAAAEALRGFGIENLSEILDVEEEPGLGNGGLGRLAACFLESLASLEIPATGYGIRYEFGIFDQLIRDGWQVEITDKWLKAGWPWELPQPDQACFVGFGGRTETYRDERNVQRSRWIPAEHAIGIPHDVPVLGYRVNTCDRLRLWRADATESFDFYAFNIGDYYGAVEEKVGSETLSKVLYPNDGTDEGRRLRLKQQHFFVSCSLQDMIRSLEARNIAVHDFPEHWAVQLNDTHPSIAVAELMRLLLDDKRLEWDQAWSITTASLAYTNHTLLPEALETWGVDLMGSLLPRHLEIIYEINRRFLQQVRLHRPGDEQVLRRVSIIAEDGPKAVRMAHLATIGCHHVNGVAALHSTLVQRDLFPDFAALWPQKFTNVTNGVTPRRWLALANPQLSSLISEAIGDGWVKDLQQLRQLEAYANDDGFLERWGATKLAVKTQLSHYIKRHTNVAVDPASMFDVQVKRIHEYKRQHLNALQVVAHYLRIKSGAGDDLPARTVIFGGKAAPGYYMAKLIIRFINGIADTINNDPDMDGRLRVIFLPDYSVKLGEKVYPATDLSEQISTAGKEASGTGNMKFAMNGALTIGTLDGANVEIREQVGEENFFLFGRTAEEIGTLRSQGYRPWEWIGSIPELGEVLRLIEQGHFSDGDGDLFRPLLQNLTGQDPFFVLADFQDYLRAQQQVNQAWGDPRRWNRMALLNSARTGFFSSDRSIREYAERIWNAQPFPVTITCETDLA